MITETIGLDVGHTAIKAVRFRRTLRGRESVTFFQQKFPFEGNQLPNDDQRANILKEFVQSHRLTGSRLMTALSCSDLFIRTLTLPFQDTKKLTQVVPSEVEGMIPLPIEEVAVDYQRLAHLSQTASARQGPASHVLVAAVHKSTLTNHVRRMAEAGIDPGSIQVDALALLSLVQHLGQRKPDVPDNLAIIDIGASKTTVCFSHQGDPWLVRTIRWGTNQMTHMSRRQGSSPTAETDVQQETFAALVREIRRTLHAYEVTTHMRLRHAWFCGGGAEHKYLSNELARCLELESISLPQQYQPRYTPEYSVAFGLAVMGQRNGIRSPLSAVSMGAGIDLKRVMDTTLAELQERWRYLLHIGLAVLAIVLLFFVDLSVQMVLKEQRLQELKTALRTQFRAQFPDLEIITNELDQAKSALLAIQKTKNLLGDDDLQMIPVLADLVNGLPKGIALKVHMLTIERLTIQMEAETDSFESVEKIKAGLLRFPSVTEVGMRDARVGASPNQVLFRVTLTRGSA